MQHKNENTYRPSKRYVDNSIQEIIYTSPMTVINFGRDTKFFNVEIWQENKEWKNTPIPMKNLSRQSTSWGKLSGEPENIPF